MILQVHPRSDCSLDRTVIHCAESVQWKQDEQSFLHFLHQKTILASALLQAAALRPVPGLTAMTVLGMVLTPAPAGVVFKLVLTSIPILEPCFIR